jgi:hypothetical protein
MVGRGERQTMELSSSQTFRIFKTPETQKTKITKNNNNNNEMPFIKEMNTTFISNSRRGKKHKRQREGRGELTRRQDVA